MRQCWRGGWPRSLRSGAAAIVLTACFAPAPARPVDQAQVAGCLGTADLKLRLACYDALVPTPAATAASADDDHPDIVLTELKATKEKLLGRGVMTAGRLSVQGQLAFLREQGLDNAPMPVSLSRLSGELQREVRTRCSSSACNVFVEGKVVHVSLGIGIALEDVYFR